MFTGYVHEAAAGAKLSPRNADGSYPVVIITEGVGSSGIYPAELMSEASAALFENVLSFMDHPDWPSAPQERSVLKIGGRIKNMRAGVSEGKAALLGDYVPRKEYAEFIEEFADIIALSIYSLASGQKNEEGVLVIESFAPIDPYRSVDVVVAGGRGGKFSRAEESLRSIHASLGAAEGAQPGSTSAPGTNPQKEVRMDPEAKAAIESLTAQVATALAELKTATEAAEAAKAAAEASTVSATDAVEAFSASQKAIDEANLVEELSAPIIADAKAGKDVTAAIESAKALQTAIESRKSADAAAEADAGFTGYFHESAAPAASGDESFSLNLGGSH